MSVSTILCLNMKLCDCKPAYACNEYLFLRDSVCESLAAHGTACVCVGNYFKHVHVVIHLAACPDDADWDAMLLPSNIQGTVCVPDTLQYRRTSSQYNYPTRPCLDFFDCPVNICGRLSREVSFDVEALE